MVEQRSSGQEQAVDHLSPAEDISNVLEEARMILPGVQTLFGFQLIVIFNSTFRDHLTRIEHYSHLVAMALTALATAMLIAPALYHRGAERQQASQWFVSYASHLLLWSSFPLAIALCLDFYLAASIITTSAWTSLLLAAALFVVFCTFWYLVPHRRRHE